MKLTLAKTYLALIFLVSVGCQTPGVLIAESHLAISDNRKAIVAAIGPTRLMSVNGRELTSNYHDRNFKFLDVTDKTKRRYYTKVVILGARRPYELSVEVRADERNPETGAFQDIGLDQGLSLARAKTIQELLNQSRDKTSSIDGSNPF